MKNNNIMKLQHKFDAYLNPSQNCFNLVTCKKKLNPKGPKQEKNKVSSQYDIQATIKSKNQPFKPIFLYKTSSTPDANIDSTMESNGQKGEKNDGVNIQSLSIKQSKNSISSKLFLIKPTKYVFTRTPTETSSEVFQSYFAGSSFAHKTRENLGSQRCSLEYRLVGCRNSVNCIQSDIQGLYTGDSHCSVLKWTLPTQCNSEYFAKSYQKGMTWNTGQNLFSHKKAVMGLEKVNNWFVSGSLDGIIKIFQNNRPPTQTINLHPGTKVVKKLSNDKLFVAGSSIDFIDLVTFKSFRAPTEAQGVISSTVHTVFTFLTGHENSSAIIWDVRTPRFISKFQGHKGSVTGITMSSGFTFLTCSEDCLLKEWDLRTASEISSRKSEGSMKEVLVKDNFILTGGKFLTIWAAETAEKVLFHESPVKSLYLDMSRDLIFAGGYDGTLSSISFKTY